MKKKDSHIIIVDNLNKTDELTMDEQKKMRELRFYGPKTGRVSYKKGSHSALSNILISSCRVREKK